MFKINNLQFEREGISLFEPITLHLSAGSCIQLCGPNGSGKTTLLKILAGCIKPRRGALLLHGKKISSLCYHSKYLGHELALNASLSVTENLAYYAALMRANPHEITIACDFFSLQDFLSQSIEKLSAGQKHRCQLAKLLIGHRDFWLLDEPFTALDQYHVEQLIRLFKIFTDKGGIIIFTSHHPIKTDLFNLQPYYIYEPL